MKMRLIFLLLFLPLLYAAGGNPHVKPHVFILMINTFNEKMDAHVIRDYFPLMNDGDIVAVVSGNSKYPVDMGSLIKRLRKLKEGSGEKKFIFAVLTAGVAHVKEIAENLPKGDAEVIFYDYEENFPDEPEFSRDFGKTLENHSRAAAYAHKAGFMFGTTAAGRGLFDRGYSKNKWDYGELLAYADIMLVQLQSPLKKDQSAGDERTQDFKNAIGKLSSQLGPGKNSKIVLPQVVISDNDRNGVTAAYALRAMRVIRKTGFRGMAIWFSNSPASERDTVRFLGEVRSLRED